MGRLALGNHDIEHVPRHGRDLRFRGFWFLGKLFVGCLGGIQVHLPEAPAPGQLTGSLEGPRVLLEQPAILGVPGLRVVREDFPGGPPAAPLLGVRLGEFAGRAPLADVLGGPGYRVHGLVGEGVPATSSHALAFDGPSPGIEKPPAEGIGHFLGRARLEEDQDVQVGMPPVFTMGDFQGTDHPQHAMPIPRAYPGTPGDDATPTVRDTHLEVPCLLEPVMRDGHRGHVGPAAGREVPGKHGVDLLLPAHRDPGGANRTGPNRAASLDPAEMGMAFVVLVKGHHTTNRLLPALGHPLLGQELPGRPAMAMTLPLLAAAPRGGNPIPGGGRGGRPHCIGGGGGNIACESIKGRRGGGAVRGVGIGARVPPGQLGRDMGFHLIGRLPNPLRPGEGARQRLCDLVGRRAGGEARSA